MGNIRRLPPAVVNQIAAGEVIERPASVVKELLENSLDAAATRVEVTVEQGGRDLIRVWDNGCGIATEELALAVAPHATSKLDSADDLFRVRTFGFRGEALASIASVSQLRMMSRPGGQVAGAQIEAAGAEIGPVVACGCPEGTTVEVRNLFYNTPVRRRFLKATQTEIGHIVEAFTRVALGQPRLAMVLRHNDKSLFDLPASSQLLERLALFFGRELAEKLIWLESEHAGRRLSGYVADPSQSRSHPRMQYIFINGRFIRDRSLSHALSEAYRGLLMVGRYPIAFLFCELPPDQVDVNIHPTKLEVRFLDPHSQYSQLLATLRHKFLASDLTARLQVPASESAPSLDDGEGFRGQASGFSPPREAEAESSDRVRDSLRDFLERAHAAPRSLGEAAGGAPADAKPSRVDRETLQLRPYADRPRTPTLPFPPTPTWTASAGTASPASPTSEQGSGIRSQDSGFEDDPTQPNSSTVQPFNSSTDQLFAAIQVHNSYLVVETSDGLMVIDQHALHERVLYEELRGRVLSDSLESQRLLVPEMVELSAAELAAVSDQRELLAQLGMAVEPFGGTTIALHTYPAMLANLPADRMLRDVIDALTSGTGLPSRRDVLDKLLHMIACKAAIKAGQRLTAEEIQSLVAQHQLAQDSHHCPHGRPTALVFTKGELDRQFKRT
ncbi:MAG: DNA mismatch repair endonuclease MutL [Planctomycetes bacterium]|nr:DNA mismatch repair endonuclease MutL [Planctomycetota bacterium]